MTKLPFLSPEARYQRQSIGSMIEFDRKAKRFRVPPSLDQSPASIFAHDIIANGYDPQHLQDLEIERVEAEDGSRLAYCTGTPPTGDARLEIVRPLGEAHDVYALDALLYYILTGRHHEVEQLSHFVASLPLARFQVLPRDATAISSQSDTDAAWLEVAESIRETAARLRREGG